MRGPIQVQPHHIAQAIDKVQSVRKPEDPLKMWLQPLRSPGGASRSRHFVPQCCDVTFWKTVPPQRNLPPVPLGFDRSRFVLLAPCGHQDNAGQLLHANFDPHAFGEPFQYLPVLRIQFRLLGSTHGIALVVSWRANCTAGSYTFSAVGQR